MIETEPKKIEVGTPEMNKAFLGGVENYVPTAGGHEMREEGGVTVVSLENLRELAKLGMCGPVRSIEIGKNQGVLVRFGGFECYLATGFSIGYRGEGPTGLAMFAEECGFGKRSELSDVIAALHADFRGALVWMCDRKVGLAELQAEFSARKDGDFWPLVDSWSRSTSEALADALGLESAYGETNPDEPGDYLPSQVAAEKIDWEKLTNLEGCEWHPGVTVEVIKDLVAQGYSFEFSPSY